MDENISHNETNPEISPEPVLSSKSDTTESSTHSFLELVKFFILAALIVFPIRAFVAQPFVVQGASMDPTYATGQYLIIDELSYKLESPKRGDVIVLRYPKNPSVFFIKRIIGLPGETVSLKDGTVTITSNSLSTPLVLNEPYVKFPKQDGEDNQIVTLAKATDAPHREYFVMGDNRAKSSDSRAWGTLPENLIVGRALIRLFPFDKMSFLVQ